MSPNTPPSHEQQQSPQEAPLPQWTPGQRVSIAVLRGGYKERNNPSRWNFATVLVVTEAVDRYAGPRILLCFANGDVTWRNARHVHEEWHYWPEAEFRAAFHRGYMAAVWGETPTTGDDGSELYGGESDDGPE